MWLPLTTIKPRQVRERGISWYLGLEPRAKCWMTICGRIDGRWLVWELPKKNVRLDDISMLWLVEMVSQNLLQLRMMKGGGGGKGSWGGIKVLFGVTLGQGVSGWIVQVVQGLATLVGELCQNQVLSPQRIYWTLEMIQLLWAVISHHAQHSRNVIICPWNHETKR